MVLPQLATLWLGNNRISDWESVDALSGLKALQELRLTGNPVAQGAEGEARAEVKQCPQPCARHCISLMHAQNRMADRSVTDQPHLQVRGLFIGITTVPIVNLKA